MGDKIPVPKRVSGIMVDGRNLGIQDSNGELVFGIGMRVRANVSSQDVIHSFAVSKLNVHVDSLPGRSATTVL